MKILAALRAAVAWEKQLLAERNRLPGLEMPAAPWLASAEKALAEHDAHSKDDRLLMDLATPCNGEQAARMLQCFYACSGIYTLSSVSYTLAQIRNGTGWACGQRFIALPTEAT